MRQNPQVGEFWRHYGGAVFEILAVAKSGTKVAERESIVLARLPHNGVPEWYYLNEFMAILANSTGDAACNFYRFEKVSDAI